MNTNDTLFKIVEYLPRSSRNIANVSLLSKNIYDTITEDEYNILWKWYTNNSISNIRIHGVNWLRIADLFMSSIKFQEREYKEYKGGSIRRSVRGGSMIHTHNSSPISKTKLQHCIIKIEKLYEGGVSISIGKHEIYRDSYNTNNRNNIISIITDLEHGVIYFFYDDNIKRFQIKNNEEDMNITLKFRYAGITIISNRNDDDNSNNIASTILSEILTKYGYEIFTCNMQPYEYNITTLELDNIISHGSNNLIDHLIKYNRITLLDVINKDRIYKFVYSKNITGLKCLSYYCDLKAYKYNLIDIVSCNNINNEDIEWILANVIDSTKLYVVDSRHKYSWKIAIYDDMLRKYGIRYNVIGLDVSKAEHVITDDMLNIIIRNDVKYDIIKLDYHGITSKPNNILPLFDNIPLDYPAILDIFNSIVSRYTYEYNKYHIKYIPDDNNVIIQDGLNFKDSLRQDNELFSHVKNIHSQLTIIHKNGEYNIIIASNDGNENNVYYTTDVMDVIYCICYEKGIPMLDTDEGIFILQCRRGTIDDNVRISLWKLISDINRSVLLDINPEEKINELLSELTYIDILEPRIMNDKEYIRDCFYLTPNIRQLDLIGQKFDTLNSLIYLTELKHILLDHCNINEFPHSLIELAISYNIKINVSIRDTKIMLIPRHDNLKISYPPRGSKYYTL